MKKINKRKYMNDFKPLFTKVFFHINIILQTMSNLKGMKTNIVTLYALNWSDCLLFESRS